ALGESHRTGEGRGRGGGDVYSAGAALSPEPAELIVAGLNAPDSSVRSSRLRRVISSHISLPAGGSAGPGGTTVGRGSRPVVVRRTARRSCSARSRSVGTASGSVSAVRSGEPGRRAAWTTRAAGGSRIPVLQAFDEAPDGAPAAVGRGAGTGRGRGRRVGAEGRDTGSRDGASERVAGGVG